MSAASSHPPAFEQPGLRPARAGRIVAFGLALVLSLGMVVGTGCTAGWPRSASVGWDGLVARDERDLALAGLPPEARRAFLPLTQVFYDRIASRRFNSRATFDDPSVRQFFPSVAAYSDYYAALVDALDLAHIRNNQPTRVELIGLSSTADRVIQLELRFVGRNDLPLRWWNAALVRTDEWRWEEGRWWVVPGKI